VHHFPSALVAPKNGGDPNRHWGDLLRAAHPRAVALDLDGVGELGGDDGGDVFESNDLALPVSPAQYRSGAALLKMVRLEVAQRLPFAS
jgi:hypothetical protein